MFFFLRFLAVLLLLLLSLLPLLLEAVQLPLSVTWSTATVQWNSLLPNGVFGGGELAACASSPLSPTRPSVNLAFGGSRLWNNNYGAINDLLYSPTSVNVTLLPSIPSGYINGGMAYLASGSILLFGGYGSSPGPLNDVNWSPNMGQDWYGDYDLPFFQYQAVASWSPRYGFGYAVIPNTNMVFVTGGIGAGSSMYLESTNDIWMNKDGATSTDVYQPPQWILMNPAGPLSAMQAGVAMVGMYDLHQTLVLAGGQHGYVDSPNPFSNDVFVSTNLGVNWTSLLARPWTPRFYHELLADTENILYLMNGIGNPSQALQDLWISNDFGITWTTLMTVNPLHYIQYACMGLAYTYSPNGAIASKALYSWGGRDYVSGVYAGIYTATVALSGPATIPPPLLVPSSSGPSPIVVRSNNSAVSGTLNQVLSPPVLTFLSPSPSLVLSYFSLYSVNATTSAPGLPLAPWMTTSVWGGSNQTLSIRLWIYPVSLPPVNTYATSTWLLWIQNQTDSIQVLVQADGTLDFLVTNGANGFYSFTNTPSGVIVPNQWSNIQITSTPLSITSLFAVHVIQVNNVTVATNENGRYPSKMYRGPIASFGVAPSSLFPTQFPFVGQMEELEILAI